MNRKVVHVSGPGPETGWLGMAVRYPDGDEIETLRPRPVVSLATTVVSHPADGEDVQLYAVTHDGRKLGIGVRVESETDGYATVLAASRGAALEGARTDL